MPKSVLDVRGVGQSTAEILSSHGFHSAEDLARAKIEELTAIQGFSTVRAERVIGDAKALLASLETGKTEKPATKEKPAAKVKKDQSKKEKKNKKEKKQKNGKKKSSGKDQNKKKNKKKNKSKKSSKKSSFSQKN